MSRDTVLYTSVASRRFQRFTAIVYLLACRSCVKSCLGSDDAAVVASISMSRLLSARRRQLERALRDDSKTGAPGRVQHDDARCPREDQKGSRPRPSVPVCYSTQPIRYTHSTCPAGPYQPPLSRKQHPSPYVPTIPLATLIRKPCFLRLCILFASTSPDPPFAG